MLILFVEFVVGIITYIGITLFLNGDNYKWYYWWRSKRNERTPPQFLGECMWYGVWTGNHSVGTLQPVWEDAWFRRAQWPSVLRETMSAHSSRGVFKWSEDPNWIFVRMGPAHPYEGWSGRDLPRWGVLPDMDVPGGDIYTPLSPRGEGGLKKVGIVPWQIPTLIILMDWSAMTLPGGKLTTVICQKKVVLEWMVPLSDV